MKARRWLRVSLLSVLILGAWLRLADLSRRPMHADEANQAVKTGQLLSGEGYAFDPSDHHGPTLYYFALVPAWLRGQPTLAALTETTLRLTPACFGIASLGLLWCVCRPLGSWPAVGAALLLAVSPPAVYYSRYFIQETLLVAFFLAALACGQRWWRAGSPRWAAGLGGCLGLMGATKESAPLLAAVTILGLLAAGGFSRLRQHLRDPRAVAGLLLAMAGVWLAFYSSFGSHWRGLRDSLTAFSPLLGKAVAGLSGHEKPWWYYARLFLFHREGGYVWDQTLFALLALSGFTLAVWRGGRSPRFWAISTATLAVVLSLVPYKTPWLVVSLVPGLCALAAVALARLRPPFALLAIGATALLLGWQTWRSSFWRPADPRNPYAYAHTSPDVAKIAGLARQAAPGPVKVIADEYWPLPWYLRERAQVGYWNAPPENCDGPLVIASVENAPAVQARLHGAYRSRYVGLRPGVLLVVFTPAPEAR